MDIECKTYEGRDGAWAVAAKAAAKHGQLAAIYDFGDGCLHVRWLAGQEDSDRQYLRYLVGSDGVIFLP